MVLRRTSVAGSVVVEHARQSPSTRNEQRATSNERLCTGLGACAKVSVRTGSAWRGVVIAEKIKVGQLWRRRRDGKAFIPAVKVADGWLNKAGNKRTAKELNEKYVWVELDDDARPKKKKKKKRK